MNPSKDQPFLDRLADRLRAQQGGAAPDQQTNGHGHRRAAVTGGPTDEMVIEKCRSAKNAAKFEALFDRGDVDLHHGGDDSAADLGLLGILKLYTQDETQLERLFSASALGRRSKWRDRPDYRSRTIARALEGAREAYVWDRSEARRPHSGDRHRHSKYDDLGEGAEVSHHAPSDATLIVGGKKVGASDPEVEASLRSPPFSEAPDPSPEASPFPVEALPDAAGAFVKGVAKTIGCAVDLIAAPVLAVLSAGIGASRLVEIKRGWREGVTLFVAVVAEPGDKKTPAANAAKRGVMRRQAKKRSEYKAKKAAYELELREWKAECQTARKEGEAEPPPPAEPTMERIYADDTTVEALVVILEDNPRGLLVYKDELTGWIRGLDQYKGGRGNERQHWLSIHTNTPIVVDRKSRHGDPVYLDHPFVTLAGGIQPAMLPELGGSMEDGLLDRFLFAYPRHSSTDLSEIEMDPKIEEGFARLYDSLCSLRMVEDVGTGIYRPYVTPMSPDARRRFKEIHDAIGRESRQTGFPTRLRGVWAKMRGYLARISLILSLCRCAESGEVEQVEEEDIENAAVIVAYFQSHARRVYVKLGSVTPEDLLAGELRTLLEDRGGAWKGTATELYAELKGRDASGLPENAEWLSKKARAIGESAEWLTVDPGYRGKERILKLGLANTVGTVGAVGASSVSTNGTDSIDGKFEGGE